VKGLFSELPALLRKLVLRTAAHACALAMALAAFAGRSQSYSLLHKFQGDDGKMPWGGFVEFSNVLYGTTRGIIYGPGVDNWGGVFKINKDGSGFSILRQFTGNDGSHPQGKLVLVGNTLYGTTASAGNGGYSYGNIFKIDTDGTGFTVLRNFQGDQDAAYPQAGLLLAGSTLYGTAAGSTTYPGNAASAVYSINTDGSGYTILKRFTGPEGLSPQTSLVRFGSLLFGTTRLGGAAGYGTLFVMTVDGNSFKVRHHFLGGADGREPSSELLLVGATLFGTTAAGGASQQGTIFKINVDGSGYQVIKSLSWDPDGAFPQTALMQFGGMLLGTARAGGRFGAGTIFKVGFDGTGFGKLFSFEGQNGANAYGDFLLSGTTIYATASTYALPNGSTGPGVVYALQLVPGTTTPLAQTAEDSSSPSILLPTTGAVPASYQWRRDHTNLVSGATNANLVLTNVQIAEAGAYSCDVSNEFGTATTSEAIVNVISPVPRRSVPALAVTAGIGSSAVIDYTDAVVDGGSWSALSSVTLTNPPQFVFDTISQPPLQRFYRARNSDASNPPGIALTMAQEITIKDAPSPRVQLDFINAIGPIDAWTALATIDLTNNSHYYFDVDASSRGRLYRIVPAP
jgi:uncharacterized repeat protein (TIGR03803 family)